MVPLVPSRAWKVPVQTSLAYHRFDGACVPHIDSMGRPLGWESQQQPGHHFHWKQWQHWCCQMWICSGQDAILHHNWNKMRGNIINSLKCIFVEWYSWKVSNYWLTFAHLLYVRILGHAYFPNADGIGSGCTCHSMVLQKCLPLLIHPRYISLKEECMPREGKKIEKYQK